LTGREIKVPIQDLEEKQRNRKKVIGGLILALVVLVYFLAVLWSMAH